MSQKTNSNIFRDGFVSLLLLLFITLKLTGHIDWSWWWVLSPIWGTALLVVVILFGYVAIKKWF